MNIIELRNVNKSYIKSRNPLKKLNAAVGGAENKPEQFRALRGLCFSVEPGECVGIIGRNGSGKSTLLRLLSGISAADSGELIIRGSVSAMLEPGVGFNPEYSGIKNIYLSGALGGLDKKRISRDAAKIMEFAEIPEEFHDMPVRTYSAGMLMRLGFAVMLWADSDIILVDEALGVGDIRFRAKCYQRFESLKNEGKTILFVSHDPDAVRRFCTRAIWLDKGRVRVDGDVANVTSAYMEFCVQPEEKNAGSKKYTNRYGSIPGTIKSVHSDSVIKIGEKCRIIVEVEAPPEVDLGTAGIAVSIKDRYGLDLCVFRTEERLHSGLNIVTFSFENRLTAGEYSMAVGFENRDTNPISYYEYIEGASELKSVSDREVFGLVSLPCDTEIR